MSDEPPELSESGSPIFRHQPRKKEFELAIGNEGRIKLISDHIGRHLGEPASVFHEIISDVVHIDVHLVTPTAERPFNTLITSGMSDRPMKVPEEIAEMAYAELMISLPADWPLTQEAFKDERNYWPVRLIKSLARMPHEFDTWLFWDHTVPNGDPPEPFAGTQFCCALIGPPVTVPEEFRQLKVDDNCTINFCSVLPIYAEEMDFKLRKGAEELWERFDKAELTELVDVKRKNVAKKRFGLF